MTQNEIDLINLIRDSNDSEKAIEIAMDLMIAFLKNYEELRDTSSEPHQVAS